MSNQIGLRSLGFQEKHSLAAAHFDIWKNETMNYPKVISETNLSVAWGKAFLEVFESTEVSPLVVEVKDIARGGLTENQLIRDALDEALEAYGKGSCNTVANTIFPRGLWNPQAARQRLFERYLRIYPHLRRMDTRNKYGLYFQRLIAFGCDDEGKDGFNQLDHILCAWGKGIRRRTALQASLFDPHKDHTDQLQRGFPCLQQVAFARMGKGGLAVTGFYATQHVVEKAYGNYLGLCRLGQFMAQEMGLTLDKITCIATPAKRGRPKRDVAALALTVSEGLKQVERG